jgi:hypothetical protein
VSAARLSFLENTAACCDSSFDLPTSIIIIICQ